MALAALSPADFRQLCLQEQFQFLRPLGKYIDCKFPRSGYIAPVLNDRKRVDRDATWASLLAHRAKAEGAKRDRDAHATIVRRAVEMSGLPMLNPPRPVLDGAIAVRLMAEDLRDAAARGGSVTEGDLEPLGWTPAQLAELGPLARRAAQVLAGAV